MIYTEMTKKAIRLMFDLHKEQTDKSGLPYVFHPWHVAESMDDEITATDGVTEFSPFWYRAFRFIRLESDDEFELCGASFEEYFYPMHDIARFECSDEQLNRMWDVSLNTVRCCMHEIYVDCPYYEQQQYDMDSANEALFTYRYVSDTRMQKKCITDMAHSQIPFIRVPSRRRKCACARAWDTSWRRSRPARR